MSIDFLSMNLNNKIFMMSFSGSNVTHWLLYFFMNYYFSVSCLIEKLSLSKLPYHNDPVIGKNIVIITMVTE